MENVNTAPTITTPTTLAVDIDEISIGSILIDVDSTDDADSEGAGLTYSLFSNTVFTIDEATGVITIVSAGYPIFLERKVEDAIDAGEPGYNISLPVTVTDSGGLTDEQDISILVTNDVAENTAPIAEDDSANTAQDTAVDINVLANDSDPDGDPLVIDSFNQGANGTVAQNGDVLTYTPNAGFSGSDSFTYTIDDGNGGKEEIARANTKPSRNSNKDFQLKIGLYFRYFFTCN